MPDTGLFHVLALDARNAQDGSIEYVNAVAVRCHQCGHTSTLRSDVLEHIPGGTVLQCQHCPNRQALSNARFVECSSSAPLPPPV